MKPEAEGTPEKLALASAEGERLSAESLRQKDGAVNKNIIFLCDFCRSFFGGVMPIKFSEENMQEFFGSIINVGVKPTDIANNL